MPTVDTSTTPHENDSSSTEPPGGHPAEPAAPAAAPVQAIALEVVTRPDRSRVTVVDYPANPLSSAGGALHFACPFCKEVVLEGLERVAAAEMQSVYHCPTCGTYSRIDRSRHP